MGGGVPFTKNNHFVLQRREREREAERETGDRRRHYNIYILASHHTGMLSFFNKSGEEGRESIFPSQKPKYFCERGGTHFWETKSRATKSKTREGA